MGKAAYWTLVAVTLAIYATMLAWTLPAISAAAGGLPAFDMRPSGYSFAEARAFVLALSAEGLALYRDVQLRLDLAYPALISATMFFALLHLLPRRLGAVRWAIAALALLPAIFDYLENAGIAAMLAAGPSALDAALVASTSQWSVLKAGTSTLAMSILLVALVWRGTVLLKSRKGP